MLRTTVRVEAEEMTLKTRAAVLLAVTLALALPSHVAPAESAHAVEASATSLTTVTSESRPATDSPGNIAPLRWSYQWQMWDWTQYRSNATCMSRGRQIMRAFPDVQKITCRKPPRCNYWNLFTYRKQWV
jgi:hypothetical protein